VAPQVRSWPRPNGKRIIQYVTVRGNKRKAEAKLAELLTAIDKGTFIEPSKVTVAEHVRARLAQWKTSGAIGDKTAERYGELIENQIVPHIGHLKVQSLKPLDIERWHSTLRTSAASARAAAASPPGQSAMRTACFRRRCARR